MDREKLQRGLGLFLDAMRPYAVRGAEGSGTSVPIFRSADEKGSFIMDILDDYKEEESSERT